MNRFYCPACNNPAFFENTRCEGCQEALALVPNSSGELARFEIAREGSLCANRTFGVCNWTKSLSNHADFCLACALNRTLPDLSVEQNVDLWRLAEFAKHRLVYTLLRFPNPELRHTLLSGRVTFDFLLPVEGAPPVMTGHANGLITLNLLEANDAYREKVRSKMGEPYRTLLGHIRHEVGHLYWQELVAGESLRLEAFRTLFGDDRASYEEALARHYNEGPAPDWQDHSISAYASVHPWEDWAESWAYYLHIVDTLDTAASFGLGLSDPKTAIMAPIVSGDPYAAVSFGELIERWAPLSVTINSLNRSLGTRDPSPFVLSARVEEKLKFIHDLVRTSGPTVENRMSSCSQG